MLNHCACRNIDNKPKICTAGGVDVRTELMIGSFSVAGHNPATGDAVASEPVPGGTKYAFRAPSDGAAVLVLAQQDDT